MNHPSNHIDARHVPVMCAQVLEALRPKDGGIYVDGTFGAGGYSRAILNAADCTVIGIDRDPDAIEGAKPLVAEFSGRLRLCHGRFSQMEALVAEHASDGVDGVTLDLGVSSMQIDEGARGFSFQVDGPLDMRMGQEGMSAADVVNSLSENELSKIFRFLGEEKRSRAISQAIVEARADKPFTRTAELAELVKRVLGPQAAAKKIHPATRTFQGLRLYVNGELHELAYGLMAAERLLKAEGRLAVVSFHSLEDRIVKRFIAARAHPPALPSRHLPAPDEAQSLPSFKDILKGGLKPQATEIELNPRARSARLRVAERTQAPAMAASTEGLGLPQIGQQDLKS